MSCEHSVSEAVLEAIQQGEGVEVSGTSWIAPGTTRILPPSALSDRVLCADHNSYLGKYDDEGIKAFTAMGAAISAAHRGQAGLPTTTIEPIPLSGWLLKMLCGKAASGQLVDRNGKQIDVDLEPKWVETLFDRHPWPSVWTTTVLRREISPLLTTGSGLELSPIHKGQRVGAIEVLLYGGIAFVLFLSAAPQTFDGAQVVELPLRLSFRSADAKRTTNVDFATQPSPDLKEIIYPLPPDESPRI